MSRVDVYETEADFIEFRFADEETALLAEKLFPTDMVRSLPGVIEYRADPSVVEAIRGRLDTAGLKWKETASGLTEDDMWPEWPEDDPSIATP